MSELEVEKRGAQLSLLQVTCRFHEVCSLAFLAGVPRVAGVYRFHGRRQKRSKDVEVLYVGKAIDLRRRLASYRSDHPSNRSRKTRRLLARVEFISWEECGSELEALLLENRLIQELRPAFNRAQVWPQGYWYYGLECGGGGVVLRLGHEVGGEGEWCGAFRSRRAGARGGGAGGGGWGGGGRGGRWGGGAGYCGGGARGGGYGRRLVGLSMIHHGSCVWVWGRVEELGIWLRS